MLLIDFNLPLFKSPYELENYFNRTIDATDLNIEY